MAHAPPALLASTLAALLVGFAPQDAEPSDADPVESFTAEVDPTSMEVPASIASEPERDMTIPRGLRVNEPGAYPGYTLFAPLLSKWIYLIDMGGEVVHQWEATGAPGAWVYLLDDGSLLHLQREDGNELFEGGGIGGRIQRLAPDSSVLWSWVLSDDQRCLHHDVEPMPNGNLLVIAWEKKEEREALAYGRDPGHVGEKGLWPDVVLEVRPTPPEGVEVVWEWHAWDHVIQDMEPERYAYGGVPDNPGRIDVNGDHRDQPPITAAELEALKEDTEALAALGYLGGGGDDDDSDSSMRGGDWLHTNAIAYNAEYDLIALSTPRFAEIWVIDHSTTTEEAKGSTGGRWGQGGELLWRWGNPRSYGFGDLDDQQLFYQHDPTWVPGEKPGELRLLIYNNGQDRPGGKSYSSLDELVLPFDPERGFWRGKYEAYGPTEPAWSYSDPEGFYSAYISGCQRLPNGNTLACSGVTGRLFEVARDGQIVWEYRNPYGGDVPPPENAGRAPPLALFRGTRLAPDHPGVVALLR